jgi:hypothetical protein
MNAEKFEVIKHLKLSRKEFKKFYTELTEDQLNTIGDLKNESSRKSLFGSTKTNK